VLLVFAFIFRRRTAGRRGELIVPIAQMVFHRYRPPWFPALREPFTLRKALGSPPRSPRWRGLAR